MAAKTRTNNVKIHAKTKTSRSKNATKYVKPYVAQGR